MLRHSLEVGMLCAALLPMSATCLSAQAFDIGRAAFERHLARAQAAVPAQYRERVASLCTGKDDEGSLPPGSITPAPVVDLADSWMPPARVFDDLYFVGDLDGSVWALTTSAGILLIDASFGARVEDRVVRGLERLGLDPRQIKYVVVTHGHDDHYGGAKFLQEQYGARVVMGEADWNIRFDPRRKGYRDPVPRRDIAANDQQLTLGDHTITILATPGHTPGTLSLLIPVTDHGEPHLAALWGGGMPYYSLPAMETFAASTEKFTKAASMADVLISNHMGGDDSLPSMASVAQRAASEPHPFVVGAEFVQKRMTVLDECARAYIALKKK